MKKHQKYIALILIMILIVTILIIANGKQSKQNDKNFKIVTSFYPMYIMANNIVEGAQDVELVNMAEINSGCIHDYNLNTSDMKKIEMADVFIKNGLDLEIYVDKITESNKQMKIIDSSENNINIIKEDDEINPHIWTSISNYINQVKNITEGLKKSNPSNAYIYEENSNKYIKRLEKLKSKYEEELKSLKEKSVVILNESFEYLAEDLGLKNIVIHTSHEESTMSAEMLKSTIDKMKENKIKIIIVDQDDDLKNAQTISNETGANIYKLNSCITGNLDKDAYINSMESNLEILKQVK